MNVPNIGANFEISGYSSVKCTGNPETDAQNFADANGISLEEAKSILSSNFGSPVLQEAQNVADMVANSVDEDAELVDWAEDDNTTALPNTNGKTPDAYAQEYADANNMTLDEAKELLKSLYGDPVLNNSNNEVPDDFTLEERNLYELGIPVATIQEGKAAVIEYAEENDIELPEEYKEESKSSEE